MQGWHGPTWYSCDSVQVGNLRSYLGAGATWYSCPQCLSMWCFAMHTTAEPGATVPGARQPLALSMFCGLNK